MPQCKYDHPVLPQLATVQTERPKKARRKATDEPKDAGRVRKCGKK